MAVEKDQFAGKCIYMIKSGEYVLWVQDKQMERSIWS